METSFVQRWRNGRQCYRPAGKVTRVRCDMRDLAGEVVLLATLPSRSPRDAVKQFFENYISL